MQLGLYRRALRDNSIALKRSQLWDRFDLPCGVSLHIRKLDIRTNMVRNQIDFMPKGREY